MPKSQIWGCIKTIKSHNHTIFLEDEHPLTNYSTLSITAICLPYTFHRFQVHDPGRLLGVPDDRTGATSLPSTPGMGRRFVSKCLKGRGKVRYQNLRKSSVRSVWVYVLGIKIRHTWVSTVGIANPTPYTNIYQVFQYFWENLDMQRNHKTIQVRPTERFLLLDLMSPRDNLQIDGFPQQACRMCNHQGSMVKVYGTAQVYSLQQTIQSIQV